MQSEDFADPRYVLFGLVSYGMPSCGKFDLPAVYTNVSHYLPWIFKQIQWTAARWEKEEEAKKKLKLLYYFLVKHWTLNKYHERLSKEFLLHFHFSLLPTTHFVVHSLHLPPKTHKKELEESLNVQGDEKWKGSCCWKRGKTEYRRRRGGRWGEFWR